MSFGKRSAGDPRPAPPPIVSQAAPESDRVLSVRTRVANNGGIDKSFIAIAAGVVILSAGGAIAAPSVLNMFEAGKPRTIAELVKGLGRDEVKAALATEAFPDAEGRAFLQSLEANFPESYDRLLGRMTNTARTGGDRDALMKDVAQWNMDFAPANFEYLGRTGAEGFDGLLHIVKDALDVVGSKAGDCSLASFQRLVEDEKALMSFADYGSAGYKVTMRANLSFVDLAAKGRNAPKPVAKLTADDDNALQSVFFSFMTDPQMMQLAQQAMRSGGDSPEEMQQAIAKNMDICQIGRSIIVKLERLPSGTKSRLLAVAFSGDFSMMQGPMMGMGGMGGMSGFGPPPGMHPDVMRRLEEMQ